MIKSNNPHLAGGEISKNEKLNLHFFQDIIGIASLGTVAGPVHTLSYSTGGCPCCDRWKDMENLDIMDLHGFYR